MRPSPTTALLALLAITSSRGLHPRQLHTARRLTPRAAAPANDAASVVFIIPESGLSSFGATSPRPNPSWNDVATQLARRLPVGTSLSVVCRLECVSVSECEVVTLTPNLNPNPNSKP